MLLNVILIIFLYPVYHTHTAKYNFSSLVPSLSNLFQWTRL